MSKLNRPIVLLLMAASLAGFVSWVAYYYLQKKEEAIKAEIAANGRKNVTPKVSVVVPRADVPAGTVLNGNNFVARPVEEDLVYPDTVLAADFGNLEGQKIARPILRGRPVRLSDLVVPEVRDVSSILPAGRRAMTIDIDNVNSIAKTLKPNHRVDIFLISKAAKSSAHNAEQGEAALEQATLFMQNMTVLATGNEFYDVMRKDSETASKMMRPGEVQGRDKDFDTVTLLVTPAEAARLMVGQKMGTYRIVLRGAKDQAALALRPLRAGDLMPAPQGRDAGIEFIVGGRGNKIVSNLAVPPSQDAAALAAQAQALAAARAATAGGNYSRLPVSSTSSSPSTTLSPASLPIPALRK